MTQQLLQLQQQLARAQQSTADQYLAREAIEKELVHERILRIHAEKERDAYASAYEASIRHFERWSQRKQLHKVGSTSKPGAAAVDVGSWTSLSPYAGGGGGGSGSGRGAPLSPGALPAGGLSGNRSPLAQR